MKNVGREGRNHLPALLAELSAGVVSERSGGRKNRRIVIQGWECREGGKGLDDGSTSQAGVQTRRS